MNKKIAPLSLSSLRLSPSAPDLLFPLASDLWFRALPRAFCVVFRTFYRISQTFLSYFIVFYLKISCILSEFK